MKSNVQKTQSTTPKALALPMKPSSAKKWYHLKLFPKFALIFFLVVAMPVSLIAFSVSSQSKAFILESIDQFIDDMIASMESVSQAQQQISESVLEETQQQLLQLNQESFSGTTDALLSMNRQIYEEHIEKLRAEARALLDEKLQALNQEIAGEIAGMLAEFVEESQTVMNTLADNTSLPELNARREEQFREVLAAHRQFVHLRFLDNLGLITTAVTREVAFYQESEAGFTPSESALSSAFSGQSRVVPEMTADGIPLLHLFIPVYRRGETVGVLFGVVAFSQMWERIQTRFFQHDEQIYLIDDEATLLSPTPKASVQAAQAAAIASAARAAEARGTFRQGELAVCYTRVPQFDWKVMVLQPLPALDARLAATSEESSAYRATLADRLQSTIQQQQKHVEDTMLNMVQTGKKRSQERVAEQQMSFQATIVELTTQNIVAIASKVSEKTLRTILPIIFSIGLLAIVVGIGVAGYVIRPINRVAAAAYNISQGNVDQAVPVVNSHDELELLSRSFQETTRYLRRMVNGAQKISEGNFADDISPVSDKDALGAAFRTMTAYLREIVALATNISRGDLSQVVNPKSEVDALGHAIHRMTIYLQRIARIAHKVAGGDLSEHPQPQSENDVLGNAFVEMILKLRHIVSKIRMDSNQLVVMSQESLDRAQEEADSVEKISLSVEETSSSMTQMAMSIEEVNNNMQGLASFVGETTSSIEEMTSSIKQIVLHSEQLASASEETSASIQQISASLQEIAGTSQHSKMLSDSATQDAIAGRDAVEKMIHSMKVIRQMVTVTAEAIQLLHKRTESIEKILGVIKDISNQTSLLSINASIIAKKAGERGLGFNVIADKVRKLADQSNSSAKEIAMIIRHVRKEAAHAVEVVAMGNERVEEGVTLAEMAGKALEQIILSANESSSVVSKIAETTSEQTKISQHIMESMDHVVEMVNQIKKATKEQEKSSSYIVKQVEQILLSSEQVKQSTSEQTKVVKHVSLAMDDIRGLIQMTSGRAKESAQAASMLSQHATALKQLVSQFTI